MGTASKVGAGAEVPGVLDHRTLDPFGILLHQEVLATHARTRVGHHGLFFDNLTAPTATTQLPGSAIAAQPSASTRGVYLTHNRVYDPRLGRFLQHDPNASGSPALDSLASMGAGLLAPGLTLDLESRLADGGNLFGAYAASPVMNSDPTGLFIQLLAPTTTFDVYMDYNDEVIGAGVSAINVIQGMFQGAAMLQSVDAAWALNWDLPDDWLYRVPRRSEAVGDDAGPRLAMGTRGALGRAVLRANRTIGLFIESTVRDRFGGVVKRIKTPLGDRVVDNVTGRKGVEIKSGYVGMSPRIRKQIEKDGWIIRNSADTEISRMEWVFVPGRTGRFGMADSVRELLVKNGIKITELGP